MFDAETFPQSIQPASARPMVRLPEVTRSDVLVGVLLVFVLFLGAYFRFTGQNWDDFVHFHPDERFLAGVVSALGGPLNFTLNNDVDFAKTIEDQAAYCNAQYPNSDGVGGFFDARCSNYNPHNTANGLYVYGTVPLFIAKWASTTVAQLTNDPVWAGYEGASLVWRFVSALADMGTIIVVFLIGLRLHHKWVGLLAAAMYACAPFAIQQSHFGTVDAMATFFTVLTLYFAARVQTRGTLVDYGLFGLMCAAAVASRINLLPLAGMIIVAAFVRLVPALDRNLSRREREGLIGYHIGGLFLAGVVTVVAFRFLSPYTFMGPSIFGLAPNPRFFADVAQSRYLVSGDAEMPPNWQWVGRPGYLFPLWNMVLWGMGVGMGITGWLCWLWSGWRLIRGRLEATRNLIPFVWIAGYFAFIGNLWVMTMRYYLPLYPTLALLAAWGLVEVLKRAFAPAKAAWRRLTAVGLTGGVVVFCGLWGMMFTNIYRHQFTVVQASDWIWENVPGDFAMRIDNSSAPLINIGFPAPMYGIQDDTPIDKRVSRYETGHPYAMSFVAPADGVISSVHAPHLGDPNDDPGPESLRVSIFPVGGDAPLGTAVLVADLKRDRNVLGNAYDLKFDKPVTVQKGQTYQFEVDVVDGGPVISSGEVMTWEGDWEEVMPAKTCTLPVGMTLADDPQPGMFNPHTCDGRDVWGGLLDGYKLEVVWEDNPVKRDWMANVLDHTDYIIIGTNRRYDTNSRIPSRFPMTMRFYDALFSGELGFEVAAQFQETFEFGPFRASDQYLPTYTAPRWLNEFEAEEAFHVYDHPVVFLFRKTDAYSHDKMHSILYDVPLSQTNQVSGGGTCLNAPTFPICDPQMANVVPLVGRAPASAPTQLQLTEDMQNTQYGGGTWSDRFFDTALINTQPVLTVVFWWLTIMVFGWLAFPLLFALFPSLADRGYSFAKFAGILLVAWLAWFASSVRIPLWSQGGILICLLILVLLSGWMGWRKRRELMAYIRENRRRLMLIELITLLAFLGFLAVRLTNPDLWHPGYGGEKPMDFAYFNGVLRSTIFPPIDPWYADGYINYYYFGYVIVGTPVLLLGMIPSVAYNLILPTLFAMTGMGAFSVAYNLVQVWTERRAAHRIDTAENDAQPPPQPARLGNPWVAGIAALLLAVVLGNLDTPRVAATGLAQLGGYQPVNNLQDFLVKEYTDANGAQPDGQALLNIVKEAGENRLTDWIRYDFATTTSMVTSFGHGVGEMLGGKALNIDPSRWFWGPTRILAETPGVEGQAINEMPYFTFLYGDLHAHMINMPLLLLIMAFLLNEVLLASDEQRSRLVQCLGLAFGALCAGLVRATNTWDWPSFMVLCGAGLTFCWWLRWRHGQRAVRLVGGGDSVVEEAASAADESGWLNWWQGGDGHWLLNRRSLINFVLYVGGFVAMSFVLIYPYTAWYAATYNSIQLWDGGKSPLWAYLDIHGVFLFLIFTLLVWDTGRWFREVRVRSLRGTWLFLVGLVFSAVIVMAGVLLISAKNYQVTLVTVPLTLWAVVLFFRRGQARPMQFVLALVGFGLMLTLAVEFIVISGDIGRQNTVFKFYIQAWLLFSVTGGAAFAWVLQSTSRWSSKLRGSWLVIAGVLVFIAALYPLMATRGKAVFRMGTNTPLTLDGMEYMKYSQQGENGVWFPLVDDYNMIRWLQDNVQGSPIIMEGRSAGPNNYSEYHWNARIAIYTGLPSVLGWNFHQRQQRTFDQMPRMVELREANIIAFYTITDIPQTWAMVEHYNVSYIIVGGLEKAYYPPDGLAKFDEMVGMGLLEVAYQNENSKIYRVNRDKLNIDTTVMR